MRRALRRAVVAGAALTLLLSATAADVSARGPSISISTPRAYQVVQRNAAGQARILVVGHMKGVSGPVQVRWGVGRWTTASCSLTGRFRVLLRARRSGQGSLTVRSARDHAVVATRPHVGIGDIYVIAGQSNASGRSSTLFAYSHPTLRAALFGNDFRWHELSDPTDSAVGQVDRISCDLIAGGSVWPGVATGLMAVDAVPVAFVPCARGTTTMERWSRRAPRPQSGISLYGSMMRRIAAVGGRVRAVLFWQGEADARGLTPRSVYERALRRFAADVGRDCGAPVVVAQIGDYRTDWYTAPGVDAIRLAQEHAWRYARVVQGPALYDIDLENNNHFGRPDDVETAARRWAAAILRGVLGREVARSPRLRKAVYDGDRAVTLTVDPGLMPLAPGPSGGFVVRSSGVEVPLAGASVTAADTVTLTLAEPASGSLTVTLGSGRTAAGAPVPAEGSAWRLPLLMFVDAPVAPAGG